VSATGSTRYTPPAYCLQVSKNEMDTIFTSHRSFEIYIASTIPSAMTIDDDDNNSAQFNSLSIYVRNQPSIIINSNNSVLDFLPTE
jgi:hypothetical protein